MTPIRWFLLYVMVMAIIDVFASIALIGEARKPRSRADAIAAVIVAGTLIALILGWLW